jgi:WD40 repeat protein
MLTARIFSRASLIALLAILAIGRVTAARAAPPDNPKDALFPGAKLVHKFPKEVYRVPVLVATDKGPCLEIWFDAFDPEPPPKAGQIPGISKLPEPRIDFVIWDPIANKEEHKLAYPKDPLAFPHVSSRLERDGGMALSPDGKQLASRTSTYTPRPGSPLGDFRTQIKLIDAETQKVQLGAEYTDEKAPSATPVYLLFAPDGALVTIRGSTCSILEPGKEGKEKPRTSFELTRAADYKTKWYWCMIQNVVISPDGSQLAVAADGTIIVYDLTTGKKLFEAARAAPAPKKGGDPAPLDVSLVYAPSARDPQLLAVESVGAAQGAPGAPPQKEFVLIRLFSLKDQKEVSKWTLSERSGVVSGFYTAKGEPRVLANGKLIDGASGKELHKFDPGVSTFVSSDGKALVRMTKKKKDERPMTVEVWTLENEK